MLAAEQVQSPQATTQGLVPTSARYLPASRELEIAFGNHFKGRWSVDSLQMLRIGEHGWEQLHQPTDAELSEVVIWAGKDVVEFPAIDQHYSIPALLRGQLGSKQWMQQISTNTYTA
ncbi:MAG: hypothetical protein ACFB0D_05995 [Phormidesmis sp.]